MFQQNKSDIKEYSSTTGTYNCTHCGHALFDSSKKFDAGCGFPSFWQHKEEHVLLKPLDTYGRTRIQLLCNNCNQHLGHLFDNLHTPTKVRYCINANSIRFQE